MPSDNRMQLSEEQIALSLARKSKKQTTVPHIPQVQSGTGKFLVRDWVNIKKPSGIKNDRVKLMTWNMLAQCLVRRELFPTSDCLKAGQREGMLINEILKYRPDIICLQEVDRLEKLLPPLHDASYAETYAAGPGKRHGCMIVYRDTMFEKVKEDIIYYDEVDTQEKRRGSSRCTKNIGLIVGLRRRDRPDHGYIVATTHLFWHPSFTYERTRQAGLLLRAVTEFQKSHALQHWPCLMAGDFNFTPTDPAYSLLVGDPLTAQQAKDVAVSRVVHASIDPSIVATPTASKDEDEGEAAKDDSDRVITNARPARPEDGLLSDKDLETLFQSHGVLRSVYDEGQRFAVSEHESVIGVRVDIAQGRKGVFEPMWTSYTQYWKTTLDYIFILDPPGNRSEVLGFLKTHRTSDLQDGLPLKGICASDHVSLIGEIETTIDDNTM